MHTPEPWTVARDSYGVERIWGPEGESIACAESDGFISDEERIANRNLIVASPELLAALKRLLDEQSAFVTDTDGCECGENGNGFDDAGQPCAHIQAMRAIALAERKA